MLVDIAEILWSMQNELPKYDGSTDPQCWISTVNEFFDSFHSPESLRLRMAPLHLEGRARSWFEWMDIDSLASTWSEFISHLLDRFESAESYAFRRQGMSRLMAVTAVEDSLPLVTQTATHTNAATATSLAPILLEPNFTLVSPPPQLPKWLSLPPLPQSLLTNPSATSKETSTTVVDVEPLEVVKPIEDYKSKARVDSVAHLVWDENVQIVSFERGGNLLINYIGPALKIPQQHTFLRDIVKAQDNQGNQSLTSKYLLVGFNGPGVFSSWKTVPDVFFGIAYNESNVGCKGMGKMFKKSSVDIQTVCRAPNMFDKLIERTLTFPKETIVCVTLGVSTCNPIEERETEISVRLILVLADSFEKNSVDAIWNFGLGGNIKQDETLKQMLIMLIVSGDGARSNSQGYFITGKTLSNRYLLTWIGSNWFAAWSKISCKNLFTIGGMMHKFNGLCIVSSWQTAPEVFIDLGNNEAKQIYYLFLVLKLIDLLCEEQCYVALGRFTPVSLCLLSFSRKTLFFPIHGATTLELLSREVLNMCENVLKEVKQLDNRLYGDEAVMNLHITTMKFRRNGDVLVDIICFWDNTTLVMIGFANMASVERYDFLQGFLVCHSPGMDMVLLYNIYEEYFDRLMGDANERTILYSEALHGVCFGLLKLITPNHGDLNHLILATAGISYGLMGFTFLASHSPQQYCALPVSKLTQQMWSAKNMMCATDLCHGCNLSSPSMYNHIKWRLPPPWSWGNGKRLCHAHPSYTLRARCL